MSEDIEKRHGNTEVQYFLNPKDDDSYYDSDWQENSKRLEDGSPIIKRKKKVTSEMLEAQLLY